MDNEFNIGDLVCCTENKQYKQTIKETYRTETENNYYWMYLTSSGNTYHEHEIELFQEEKENYKLKYEKMEVLAQEQKNVIDNNKVYIQQIINERNQLRNENSRLKEVLGSALVELEHWND